MSVHHDQIIETMLRSLETGCPVITADGDEIGRLSEVGENAIKINAPMRRDFWVKADYVRDCEDGRVALTFLKKDLGAYRMDNEGKRDDPLTEQKGDHIISEEEQYETRLRMEQELAQQRRALPHLHPQGEEGPPDTFGTLGEPVERELERHDAPAFERERDAWGSDYGYDSDAGQRSTGFPKLLLIGIAFAAAAAGVWFLRRRS